MLLKGFRVTEFRSVSDSEWIDAEQVTALIGTNESGKTNILLPLWKLNPAEDGAIDLQDDLPRDKYHIYRDAKNKPVFIRAKYALSQAEAMGNETTSNPNATQIEETANGVAVVYHSNPRGNKLHSYQLIDSFGNALTPWVDYLGDYVSEEGLRRIQISDLWGFSDLFGNIIIQPQYKFALNFFGGLAPVEVENKGWGFIDSSGKFHTPPAHTLAALSALQTDKAKHIPPQKPEYSYNIICENGKAGIADSENNIIIAPMFEEVKLLHPNIIGAKWCDFWDIIIL